MGYIQELRSTLGSKPLIVMTAGVMVLDSQNRLLLQRRADNRYWSIPGGSMELGENLEQTARRELQEETGTEEVQVFYQEMLPMLKEQLSRGEF